jgi:hypothetical protein
LVLSAGGVGVEGFGTVDDDGGEGGVEFFEDLFGETGANVADCFVGFGGGVPASEEECAVDGGTLALAVVCTEHYQIERVTDSGKVVLLDL